MPNQYVNPEVKPCTGSYTWVPDTPVNFFGGVNPTVGFQNLIIDRGAFRNYYLRPDFIPDPKNPPTTSPYVSTTYAIEGDSVNLYNPIINSTRPLAINGPVKISNNENLVVKASGSTNLSGSGGYVDFLKFDFPVNDVFRRLSCIKIEYDLSFHYKDEAFNNANFELNPAQNRALAQLQSGDLNAATAFITGLTPPVMQLYGVDNSGAEKIIGEVPLTRARIDIDESDLVYASETETLLRFQTKNIKTLEELLDRNKFPQYKTVKFKIRSQFADSSIVLVLKKIAFFTADRVNFRYIDQTKQLPCAALGYSMFVNGTFYPGLGYASILASGGGSVAGTGGVDGSGAFAWPQDNRLNGCNIHVKLFNPDFTTGSPGFAHSLNLHLIVLSFPAWGPLAEFFLPGVLYPHYAVIVGPFPFNQQLIFYGNSNYTPTQSNLAVMGASDFRPNTKNISNILLLEKGQGASNPRRFFQYKDGVNNAIRNQFYYEIQGIGTSFQNIFVADSGVETTSGVYEGTLPRNNTAYLNATSVPELNSRVQRRDFTYNTYIFKDNPTLDKLFNNSNPLLIFKLSNPDGYSSSMFQQPGFIGASVNGFVTDSSSMFNTQIVYRIYAVRANSTDINPNNDFSKKHCLKIENSGKENSTVVFTEFDNSWDFSNTLVTGNISNVLQNIFVSEIINSDQRTFRVASEDFDLYCAIYAMSVLTDEAFNLYETTDLSSLDLPLITLAIQNDFTLIFPIFYKKSYVNGGKLQAQRDFGATGEYTKDSKSYKVINQFYDGRSFDNSKPYKNKLSPSMGYFSLLKMSSEIDPSPESTSIILETESNKTAEVDFIIDFDSLSYARLGTGFWKLTLISSQLKAVKFRYEVVLVDSSDYKFVLTLVKSDYQNVDVDEESIGEISVDISVPFFLPTSNTKAIFKFYFINDANTTITFDKIELAENTIEYFQFKNRLPNSAPFGFYEDLPIQPTSFGSGCSDFILKLDLDASRTFVIYDPVQGLRIDGCLYSPTWTVALPEGMELDYRGVINESLFPRATGVRPYQIFFRTGLPNDILALDTKRHGATGLVMTTFNKSTNTSDFAVRQTVSEGYLRYSSFNNFMTTATSSETLTTLNLKNPILSRTNQALVGGQSVGNDAASTSILSIEAPGFLANQPNTDGRYYPLDTNESNRLSGCVFTSYAYSKSNIAIAGVTSEGGLIFNLQPLNNVSENPRGYFIEGDPATSDDSLDLLNATRYVIQLNGKVSVSYPGLYQNTQGCVVFYVYSSKATSNIKKESCIYAIYITLGIVSKPIEVFDFKQYCATYGSIEKFPAISNITVCNHDVYSRGNELYLAFTCSRKVFTLKMTFQNFGELCFFSVNSVAIIYGNLISSASTQPEEKAFIGLINDAIGQSGIFIFKTLDYNKNLESNQRVGFVDYDGIHLGVQFKDVNNIMEVIYDKSYSVPGQLRKIADA